MPRETRARIMQEGDHFFAVDTGRSWSTFSIKATLPEIRDHLSLIGYHFERAGTDDDKLIGYEEAEVLEVWCRLVYKNYEEKPHV